MILKVFCDWFVAPFSKGTFLEQTRATAARIVQILEAETDARLDDEGFFGPDKEIWEQSSMSEQRSEPMNQNDDCLIRDVW